MRGFLICLAENRSSILYQLVITRAELRWNIQRPGTEETEIHLKLQYSQNKAEKNVVWRSFFLDERRKRVYYDKKQL